MRSHVAARLSTWAPSVDETDRGAVAAAVADVWDRELGRCSVRDSLFGLLAARVFWRFGQPDAASRILECIRPEWAPSTAEGAWLLGGGTSVPLLGYVSMGLVRPVGGWDGLPGPTWSLRLDRLADAEQGALGLYPRVRRVLDQLTPTWDGSHGRGRLRLRGADDGAIEVREYCRACLVRTGSDRGWTQVPEVLRETARLRR